MMWWFFALCFFGFGMYTLGFYAGESCILRHDRHRNIIRSEGPDNGWWFTGAISIVVAIALAIIASNPAGSLQKRANQIRSSTTTGTLVR